MTWFLRTDHTGNNRIGEKKAYYDGQLDLLLDIYNVDNFEKSEECQNAHKAGVAKFELENPNR